MTTPRLLVLVAADTSDEEAKDLLGQVDLAVRTTLKSNVELVDSKAWYQKHFEIAGSWDAWIWSTVCERPYGGRPSHFDAYVVAIPFLGKANAGIVRLALEKKRVVLSWQKGNLGRVQDLVTLDDNNWKTGWTVRSVPVGPL